MVSLELLEPEVLPEVEGLAPMVPLLLGELDDELLVDGLVDEPEEPAVEPELDGVVVEGVLDDEEPLAPIDVPLLLGVLAEEEELSLEPLLALGVLLEELLLGVLLEPEAPIVPVDGWVVDGEAAPAAPVEAPGLPLAPLAPLVPVLPPLAELCAMA